MRTRSIRWRALVLAKVLTVAVASLAASPARSQDTMSIAAVVNDDAISMMDLSARIRLVLLSTGMENNRENQLRLADQVLNNLITETLQLQESKRLDIEIPDEQVNETIGQIAASNQLTETSFSRMLQGNGIPIATLRSQIRANLAWSQTVRRTLTPQVRISEDEITSALEEAARSNGLPESLISEIFIPVDATTTEDLVRAEIDQVYQQLASGAASFESLARQFSRSASAANGGDMGWVISDKLPGPLADAVNGLSPGQFSQPVRSVDGWHIMEVRNRRRAQIGGLDGLGTETEITLKQALLPLPAGATPQQVQQTVARAERLRGIMRSCEDIDFIHQELGVQDSGDLGTMNANAIPVEIAPIVRDLPVGQASAPYRVQRGVVMLMVCDRNETFTNNEARQEVANTLMRERLEALSRRYLRDLRRSGLIELRLGNSGPGS